MHRRNLLIESIESRRLLAANLAGSFDADINGCLAVEIDHPAVIARAAAASEPQYRVNQPPRIQLGNAPLVGTSAFDGFDQIEILWQTVSAGSGSDDSFVAKIREANTTNVEWTTREVDGMIDTGVDTRRIHHVAFIGLEWNRAYEYSVTHYRAGAIVQEYTAEFRTRLQPGDKSEFTFAAYGDSSALDEGTSGFRQVQQRINESDAAFSLLLGDNIYPSGSHAQADGRFSPEVNPEAVEWIASHVDYFAMGNHDIVASDGQPTLESFSMPTPVAGVNAFAAAPAGEAPESYGSFDYGDAHFVTINSNSIEMSRGADRDARFERQAEFLFENMAASDAKWKVVYMHHPLTGSRKFDPFFDTNFLEIVGQRLMDAGVDLVLTGDSHSFAWTYPMSGLDDASGNNEIAPDEIRISNDSPYEFQKGDGLVQLIAGVGGHQRRDDVSFPRPFQAQVHSKNPQAFHSTNGFAQVKVSDGELRVQYIAADTGHIVGDDNQNGTRDIGENGFAEFRIVDETDSVAPDVNRDGSVNASDLDAICAAIHANATDERLDLNGDSVVTIEDRDYLLDNVFHTTAGDANLDGVVNSTDLVQVFRAARYDAKDSINTGWAAGDWNCDGRFTSRDLVELFRLNVYVKG